MSSIQGVIGKVAIFAVVLGAASAADARSPVTSWSFPEVMARLDGVHVFLEGRRVRIEPDLTLCSGQGKGVVRRGERRWSSFDCIQTTARPGGRDFEFRVRILGPTRFRVTDARQAKP